jgi:hypothetical protein
MAKQPIKQHLHSGPSTNIKGHAAKLVGIVYDQPDGDTASSKRSWNTTFRPMSAAN